jgi:hypothetical protein
VEFCTIGEDQGDACASERVSRGEAEFFEAGGVRGHSRGAMRGMGKEVLRIKL